MLSNTRARLEAKIPVEVKKRLEYVAELENRSLTDVVISAINSYSEESITRHKVIKLSMEDQEALANSLLSEKTDPSKFTRLKKAIYDHSLNVEEI